MNQAAFKSAFNNESALRAAGFSALMLSVVVTIMAIYQTLATAFRAANGTVESELILVIVWVLSPYICFSVIIFLLLRFARISRLPLIFYAISVLMFLGTLFGYAGTRIMLGNRWSVYGLIFVIVPFYLHIGWFLLLTGGLFWQWLMSNKNNQV